MTGGGAGPNSPTRTVELCSYIGGSWAESDSFSPLVSPASGLTIGEVHQAGIADVDRAVASARETFETTRWSSLSERMAICVRSAELLEERIDDLSRELSDEHGKPLAEAKAEVTMAAGALRVFAEEARQLHGWSPQTLDPNKRVQVINQPRGVWAILTPWNFPLNIPIEYIGPALATGTTFVWKPAPTTARIAIRLTEILIEAGAPAGMANLLLTNSNELAQHLVSHPGINAVGLTGGSETGAAVARVAWDKHLLLELGGNGPCVVLDDADVARSADAIAASAFFNAGQVCSAAGRILVADPIADELAAGIRESASALRLGLPLDDMVTIGPVHTELVAATMDRHIADARSRGANVLVGGGRVEGYPTNLFYAPTVIDSVPLDSQLAREETFGPVAPLIRLAADDQLLEVANSSEVGLVSAVFTSSLSRAYRFAERLETGTVVINDTSNYWEVQLPFGGRSGRQSGRGRVGGRAAVREFVQSKTLSFDISY